MIQVATAIEMCEDVVQPDKECRLVTPVLSCYTNASIFNKENGHLIESQNMTILNRTSELYYINFTQSKGDYIVALCDNSTRELYVQGDDEMASLSIGIFVLLVALSFFIVPIIVKKFSDNWFVDLIIRRSSLVMGLYLMMMNAAIFSTISEAAGLGLENEMFRYMWMFGWAGWIAIVFLVTKTALDSISFVKISQKKKRMGLDGEE